MRAFTASEMFIDKDHNSQFNHYSWCRRCYHTLFPWSWHWGDGLARLTGCSFLHTPFLPRVSSVSSTCCLFYPGPCWSPYHVSTSKMGSNPGSGSIPGKEPELLKTFNSRTTWDPRKAALGWDVGRPVKSASKELLIIWGSSHQSSFNVKAGIYRKV